MIHNDGRQMTVTSWVRLDRVALEKPPNDVDRFHLPEMVQGLGGPTAPRCAGGMVGPQRAAGQPVIDTRAPACRQEPVTDGGSFTATPPPNVRDKERQRSIYAVL